jgi:hypothetical protein
MPLAPRVLATVAAAAVLAAREVLAPEEVRMAVVEEAAAYAALVLMGVRRDALWPMPASAALL